MKSPNDGESPRESDSLETINKNAAGIDIGSGEHWVCVPPERGRAVSFWNKKAQKQGNSSK